MPHLRAKQADREEIIPIPGESLTIGRGARNDLGFDDPRLADVHARFERQEEGGWAVYDLASESGVRVNGSKAMQARLKSGDRIEISGITFVFQESEAPATSGLSDAVKGLFRPRSTLRRGPRLAASGPEGARRLLVKWAAILLVAVGAALYTTRGSADEVDSGDGSAESLWRQAGRFREKKLYVEAMRKIDTIPSEARALPPCDAAEGELHMLRALILSEASDIAEGSGHGIPTADERRALNQLAAYAESHPDDAEAGRIRDLLVAQGRR